MPEWLECIAAIYDRRCVTSSCALRILLLLVNAQSGLTGGGTRDFYKRAATPEQRFELYRLSAFAPKKA